LRSSIVSVLLVSGAAVAFVILGVALFQNRLLYFPTRAPVEDLAVRGLQPWPDPASQDPEHFRGLAAIPDERHASPLRGTVVVFHGNAGHAGHRGYYAQVLDPLGLRVVLAEYPGYGPRDGKVNEASLVDDAEGTLRLAHRLHGEPLLVIGESLGAGVAAAAAARLPDKVQGLMMITPWDRLEHVGAHHYPWLPVKWLLRDRYDSVRSLADFGRPVTVVIAEQDGVVPARFGHALFESLRQPKSLLVLPGAGHNDWVGHVDHAWWDAAIRRLLRDDAAGLSEGKPR
jgi:uncharacterized protein